MCRQHRSRRSAATATLLAAGLTVCGPGRAAAQPPVLVSVASDGGPADGSSESAIVTPDGRVVAFNSQASNLVTGDTNGRSDVFVRDLTTGITTRVSITSAGEQGSDDSFASRVSDDGRIVAFTSRAALVDEDTHEGGDVYVHDRTTGRTTLIGPAGEGGITGYELSGNGRSCRVHLDGRDARAG